MRLSLINILYGVLLLCASCEDKVDLHVPPLQKPVYAVHGILTNELEYVRVYVTQVQTNANEEPIPVKNATVYVYVKLQGNGNGPAQTITFVEDSMHSGVYVSTQKYRGVVNRDYILHVLIDTMDITATARMIPISELSSFSYYKVEDSQEMYALPEQFWSQEQAMWEIDLNWDSTNTCDTCKAKTYLYTLHGIDVGQVLAPNKQRILFPRKTIAIRKKYALTDEHANYIRGILLETQWNGGYFDEQASNPTTNLSHGVQGYWGACMVLSDTVVIE